MRSCDIAVASASVAVNFCEPTESRGTVVRKIEEREPVPADRRKTRFLIAGIETLHREGCAALGGDIALSSLRFGCICLDTSNSDAACSCAPRERTQLGEESGIIDVG